MDQRDRLNLLLKRASQLGARVFRNNVGLGWIGRVERIANSSDIIIRKARPLHAGLCKGSSDIVGWRPITITREMVGMRFAQFVAIEDKSKNDVLTKEQAQFLSVIERDGGIAIKAYSVDDLGALTDGD